MGNTTSATQPYRTQEEQITHIDGGSLHLDSNLAVYTSPQDWQKPVVRALQLARKLAPYYKGLDEYDPEWSDEHLLQVLKKALPKTAFNQALLSSLRDPSGSGPGSTSHSLQATPGPSSPSRPASYIDAAGEHKGTLQVGANQATGRQQRPRAVTVDSSSTVHQLHQHSTRPRVPFGVLLYKNAVECPICFLFYPCNIATTRCCRQPICTECFVQIRRPNPHAPVVHADDPNPPPENPETLIMESPVCPYCNVADFGVIYTLPDLRYDRPAFRPFAAHERDVPASAKEVVLTDMIRPDWTAKLQRAKDRAARRAANAALLTAHLQRQERRAQAEAALALLGGVLPEGSSAGGGSEARREARRLRRREVAAIEERQLAEAIRLSMLEDEQRRARPSVAGVPGSVAGAAGERIVEQDERSISGRATSNPVSVQEGGLSRRTSAALVDTLGGLTIREDPSTSSRPGEGVSYGGHSMPMQELLYAPPPDSFVGSSGAAGMAQRRSGEENETEEEEEAPVGRKHQTEDELEFMMKAMQQSPKMETQRARSMGGRS